MAGSTRLSPEVAARERSKKSCDVGGIPRPGARSGVPLHVKLSEEMASFKKNHVAHVELCQVGYFKPRKGEEK
jgi:hypothetical protein